MLMLIFALKAGNRALEAFKEAQIASATEMQNLRDKLGRLASMARKEVLQEVHFLSVVVCRMKAIDSLTFA